MEQNDLFSSKREVELSEDGTTVGHGNPHDDTRARLNEQADAEREADPEFEYVGNEPESEPLEPRPESEGDEITDTDREVARQLQEGSEAQAADLIKSKKSGPSEEEITRLVDQRVEQVFSAQARQRFNDQNRDILTNPYLDGAAGAAFRRLRDSGDTRSDLEVMGAAVNEVRTWVRSLQQPQAAVSQEKLERKATITSLPKSSARQPMNRADDEEENPSDVIQQIAKSRGQNYASRS